MRIVSDDRCCGYIGADPFIVDIISLPIRLFPHRPLLPKTLEISRQYHTTIYDALYLSLALEHNAVIFSTDGKMLKIAADLKL